ncbi:MAG: phosphatase PAP2 family protein [Verrucomicrobiota bacterium]
MPHYRFIDYATQGYVALVGLLVLVCHQTGLPRWPVYVLVHGAVLLGIHGLIRFHASKPAGAILTFLRCYYPILLFSFMYSETGHLNQLFVRGYLDATLLRWDQALFGCQPSLEWMQHFPQTVVSETLYGAYFSYYVMVAGVGLALYFKQRPAFHHYLAVISVVFYGCYLVYIFLPVVGPRIFYMDIPGWTLPAGARPDWIPAFPDSVRSGFFYRVMEVIYDHFETPGAAFPSSHVAVALGTLYFSFQHFRRVRWLHLGAVVLLCLATVYCRYHYLVDVFGGIITGVALIALGNWLYARFDTSPGQSSP